MKKFIQLLTLCIGTLSFNIHAMETDPIEINLGEFGKQLLIQDQSDWGTLQEAVDTAQELKFDDKKILHLLEMQNKFIFKNSGHKLSAFHRKSGSPLAAGSISVYWKNSPSFAFFIHRLHVHEDYRNQGIATALMLATLIGEKKQIEKNGMPRDSLKFELSAEAYGDHGLAQEQLIVFYRSFGFNHDCEPSTGPGVPMTLTIPLKSKEEALRGLLCWKCAQKFIEYNFSNPDNDNGSLDFKTAQSIVEKKKKDGFTCAYHE